MQHHDPHNSDWMPVVFPEFRPADELRTVKWVLNEPGAPAVEMVVGGISGTGTQEVFHVTSGKVRAPNLHAFSLWDGAERWHTDPATNTVDPGPNSVALTSSTTLDAAGNLYLADGKFLFCYPAATHANARGTQGYLWRTVLPHLKAYNAATGTWLASTNTADPTSYAKPFLSLALTPLLNGRFYVGGITIAGDVLMFDPANGSLVAQTTLNRPAPAPETTPPCDPDAFARGDDPLAYDASGTNVNSDPYVPFGIWCTGTNTDDPDRDYFMNPCQLEVYLAANTAGTGTMVANTQALIADPLRPAVARLYVCARQSAESAARDLTPAGEDAMVYRVDFDPTQPFASRLKVMNYQYVLGQPRFEGRMPDGDNSATSPDISPNQRWLFTADRNGRMYAFDLEDGTVVWSRHIGASMGSPTTFQAIDAAGRFKLFGFGDYRIHAFEIDAATGRIAINPATGEEFYRVLDYEPYLLNHHWRTDQPGYAATYRNAAGQPYPRVAVGASIMCGLANRLIAVFTLGWHNPPDPKGIFLIPTHSAVVVINPAAIWNSPDAEGTLEAVYPDTHGTCEVSFIPSPSGQPRALMYYGSQSPTFAQYMHANGGLPAGMESLYLRPAAGIRVVELPLSDTPNAPPVLTLDAPTNQTWVLPDTTIEVRGQVSDPDGRVATVNLYTNGVRVAGSPYQGTWRFPWKPPGPGVYTLQAEAFDNDGARAATATLTVGVDADDDGDGLPNGRETLLGTRPDLPDTDRDGVADGDEVRVGTRPLDPASFPRLAAPVLTPPPGRYADNVWVAPAPPAPGTRLHYTTDGTDPTPTSPVYTGGGFAITNHVAGDNDPAPEDANDPLTLVSLDLRMLAYSDTEGPSRIAGGAYVLDRLVTTFNVQYAGTNSAAGNTNKHRLDIYHPLGATNNRVVFFVHGGAWKQGDKDIYLELGNTLAGHHGLTTVITSYELSPEVQHPEHMEDVAAAFAWTYNNIARYGGDPGRIIAFGQSAGAHLVSLLTTDASYLDVVGVPRSAIRGVISMSGAYDLLDMVTYPLNPLALEEAVVLGYKGLFSMVFGSYDAAVLDPASPSTHLGPDRPPFHVIHAWEDMPGFPQEAEDFWNRLAAAPHPLDSRLKLLESDIPQEVLALDYGGHYEEIYTINTRSWDCLSVRTVVEFVDRVCPPPDGAGLAATWEAGRLILNWPLGPDNLLLERSDQLGPAAAWQPVSAPVALRDNRRWLTIDPAGSAAFYRLAPH
jgi:acetyl esterase/lipase